MKTLYQNRSTTQPKVQPVDDGLMAWNLKTQEFADAICQLPGVARMLGLCDFAVNFVEGNADSLIVELKDWIVPALADDEANCGMGLINTGLMAKDLSEPEKRGLLQRLWELTRSDKFVFTSNEVDQLFLEGLGFLSRKGVISEADREAFEFRGSTLSPQQVSKADLDAVVPRTVRRLPETRRPARLSIQGNHFIELQEVDEVVDPSQLKAFGLQGGQLVLMVHTGHRITKFINHHFVIRKKMLYKSLGKRAIYDLSKLLFHYGRPAEWDLAAERWRLYFKKHEYVGLPVDSREGQRYLMAYALATNYGYGMRALVYDICRQAIQEKFPGITSKGLLWDSNHESIRVQDCLAETKVVVRRGAGQCFAGKPAIVAGSYDVPSLLGVARGSEDWGFSYDHGSKNFRTYLGERPDFTRAEPATVHRYVVPTEDTQWRLIAQKELPVHSRAAMKLLADRLQTLDILRPVAWLRPVANLKQK